MRESLPEQAYHDLAADRNLVWLGPSVRNCNTKTEWGCMGKPIHLLTLTYHEVMHRTGCPYCVRYGAKRWPDDYKKLALRHGLEWLGPRVPTVDTKTRWKCHEGHTWWTTYHNILDGKGCPFCATRRRCAQLATKRRLKPRRYHTLAKKKGFKWLGPVVPNKNAKTQWECLCCGFKYVAAYCVFLLIRGCPDCRRLTRNKSTQAPSALEEAAE